MLALDQTKAGLWDLDMENGEIFISPMLKSILGYEDFEMENSFKIMKDLSHPEDRQRLKNARSDYLQGITDNFEITHRLKH